MDNAIPFPVAGRGSPGPVARDLTSAVVTRIARICALGLGLEELLEEACREVLALCRAESGALAAFKDDGSWEKSWTVGRNGTTDGRPSPPCPAETLGAFQDRLFSESVLSVEDSGNRPAGDILKEVCAFQGVRSALFVALRSRTRLLGLLSVFDPSGPRAWDAAEVGIVRDVAAPILTAALERRAMERRLRESEARYRLLADRSLDVISLQDAAGRCLFASRAVHRMLGYRAEELIGAPFAGFVHPEDLDRVQADVGRLAAGEVPAVVHEHRLRRKDGAYAEVETLASAVVGGDEEGLQILRVTRDITERKAMERRLGESRNFETVGMIAGGVAHEFNNLLMAVSYGIETLRTKVGEDGEDGRLLRMMDRGVGRAVELTRQLLAYARRGKYAPEVVPLNRVVAEGVSVLKNVVPPSVDLCVELSDDVPHVRADIAQLKQVLMSLGHNAMEAMHGGGVLTLRTLRAVKGEERGLPERDGAHPAYAVLEVSDTGCGMDADTLSRIFDPFFSTKFVGRGMGLAAVRGIVENHGGEIRVSSETGKGTTLTVSLPGTSELTRNLEPPEEAVMRWSGTALVADDEPDVRAVLRAMLGSFGFDVIETCDGREAMDRFREVDGAVDLVILDLMMPHMTGEEAILGIRRTNPGVRAILVSGYDESGRIQEIVSRGFGAFLQKPFHRQELGRKISEVMGRAAQAPE